MTQAEGGENESFSIGQKALFEMQDYPAQRRCAGDL
jgi:hypothetical protein